MIPYLSRVFKHFLHSRGRYDIIHTMKIWLIGHEYKYAVEQMLLTLFPEERPEYPEKLPDGDRMEVSYRRNGPERSACCRLIIGGETFEGEDTAVLSDETNGLEENRTGQRLVKNAIYQAALNSGVSKPPWGALTGVRPGKILCRLLDEEKDREKARRRFENEYDVSPERAELCADTAYYTLEAASRLRQEDVCLYIGIPFCPTRCAYCSFVSQSVEKSMKLMGPFLEALEKEIRATASQVRRCGLRPVSVYFGGGTPTTLSGEQLDRLCTELEEAFDLSAVQEYTVEAGRPDTITGDKLRILKRHGVTRVSVNPQTMSDRILEVIGRRHSAEDILAALEKVRSVGGFEVNMDLIAGLPEDSVSGFEKTLRTVLELGPENITVHTLSLKNGSRITLEKTRIPSGAEVAEMLDLSRSLLRENGYGPYYLYRQKFMSGGFENIGWTKPGSANLYNICIMEELCSILAMGGGGSTKLVKPGDTRNIRIMAPKYPLEYISSIGRICEGKEKIERFYTAEV